MESPFLGLPQACHRLRRSAASGLLASACAYRQLLLCFFTENQISQLKERVHPLELFCGPCEYVVFQAQWSIYHLSWPRGE
jgi:hypothetical protein